MAYLIISSAPQLVTRPVLIIGGGGAAQILEIGGAPGIQINVPPSMPQYEHQEIPQYKEEMSTGVNKETKDKVEELERQLKQIKARILWGVFTSTIFAFTQD